MRTPSGEYDPLDNPDPSTPTVDINVIAGTPGLEDETTRLESPMPDAPEVLLSGSPGGGNRVSRSVNPYDERVYKHYSRAIVEMKHSEWTKHLQDEESIASFDIYRAYLHDGETGEATSRYQLIKQGLPASSTTVTTHNDYDVASRVWHEYKVRAWTNTGRALPFGKDKVKTQSRRDIEGHGTETGIRIYVIPLDLPVHAVQEQRYDLTKNGYNPGLMVFWLENEYFRSNEPFTNEEYETVDDRVRAGVFKGYRLNHEQRVTNPDGTFGWNHTQWIGPFPIRAGVFTPTAPLNVRPEMADDGQSITVQWVKPARYSSEVAMYEVLRREEMWDGSVVEHVVGTTKRLKFVDSRITPEYGRYSYAVRVITKQGERPEGAMSEYVGSHGNVNATCDTNYDDDLPVDRIHVERNIFGGIPGIEVPGEYRYVDAWFYGKTSEGNLDRCLTVNPMDFELQREIYVKETLSDTCTPNTTSCVTLNASPSEGEKETVSVSREPFGGPRMSFVRFVDQSWPEAGVYQHRYRLCTRFQETQLCSAWRDMDENLVGVPSTSFTQEDIGSLPEAEKPYHYGYRHPALDATEIQ